MSLDRNRDRELWFLSTLANKGSGTIILCVLDGLGGAPAGVDSTTEMEAARTPNLDMLAPKSTLGLVDPVSPGITPGSGPGHLSLFGYNPREYVIGRGVLGAAGLGLEMGPSDLAARINFCTIDRDGNVTDRRAGRIPTETCAKLCAKLSAEVKLRDVQVTVTPEKEHRAAVIFRGAGLNPGICDTDPQKTGMAPLDPTPIPGASKDAERTTRVVKEFIGQARKILSSESPANMILLRGFDVPPDLPKMSEAFGLKPAAVAVYPMYRGLARLVGMDVIEFEGETIADEIRAASVALKDHDFVYLHVKKTDSYGEDGNRDAKIHVIEDFDAQLPGLLGLKPSVLLITGDHSTPAALKAHSWHPSPLLLSAPTARMSGCARFTEKECGRGGLGRIRGWDMMPIALAHALRLDKFGA